MKTKHTTYLLLGGNIGNIENNLHIARHLITKYCGEIIAQSSIYETAAWGFTHQPNFLNQVLCINTNLSPQNLLQQLLDIEKELGRERVIKMGPRLIDIDILLFDDVEINEESLQIPHPRMIERKFVLLPLNEIASNFIHPTTKKTIHQLLTICADNLDVKKFCNAN